MNKDYFYFLLVVMLVSVIILFVGAIVGNAVYDKLLYDGQIDVNRTYDAYNSFMWEKMLGFNHV